MNIHKGTFITGLIYLAIGVAFVLEALDVWTIRFSDLRLIGPLALVVIGVAVIIGTLGGTRRQV
jgi:hypothetical protein